MKKLLLALAPLSLALTACVTTPTNTTNTTNGNSLAVAAIKVGVQAKCIVEVNNNSYWNSASKLLTAAQKQELQTQVCGCVGEKATSSVSAAEVLVAAMDKTSQASLISKVVTNTLNACVIETFK